MLNMVGIFCFFFTASALLSFVHHNFTIFVDLNVAFQQSAIRSTAHLDEFFENFQVRLDQKANDIFNGYKSLFIFVLYSLLLFFVLFFNFFLIFTSYRTGTYFSRGVERNLLGLQD